MSLSTKAIAVSDLKPTATRFFKTRVSQELIGRLPNGEKIPGGPYTIAQVVAAVVVGSIALKTKPLWQTGGWLMDWGLVVLAVVGTVVLLKHTVSSEPELLKLRVLGWIGIAGHRKASPGTYRGVAYQVRPKGHKVTGSVLIDRRALLLPELAPEAIEPVRPPAAPAIQTQPVMPTPAAAAPEQQQLPKRSTLSGVDHLLASSHHRH